MSPTRFAYGFSSDSIEKLRNIWPEKNHAVLIWFNKTYSLYQYSVKELKAIAELEIIYNCEDGTVYSVKKRPLK